MRRIHLHMIVKDLDESIKFYSTLFGADPVVKKDDYAKWMLDNPRVNFAMTQRDKGFGIDHFGIQVETEEELRETERGMQAAGRPLAEVDDVQCCYSRIEQAFSIDPQGVNWEAFRTLGSSPLYCDSKQLFRSVEFHAKAALHKPAAVAAVAVATSDESCCK